MERNMHALFAAAFAYIFSQPMIRQNPDLLWPTLFFSLLAGIFPDFDLNMGHRKLLHNIIVLAITSYLISRYDVYLAQIWLVAYGSHLILDMLTPAGVALFGIGPRVRFPLHPVLRYIFIFGFLVIMLVIYAGILPRNV